MKLWLLTLIAAPLCATSGTAAEKDTKAQDAGKIRIAGPIGSILIPRDLVRNKNIVGVWGEVLDLDPTTEEIPVIRPGLTATKLSYFVDAARLLFNKPDFPRVKEKFPPDVVAQLAKEIAPQVAAIDPAALPDLMMLAHALDAPVLEHAFVQNFARHFVQAVQKPSVDWLPESVRQLIAEYAFLQNPDNPIDTTPVGLTRLGLSSPVSIPLYQLILHNFFPWQLLNKMPVNELEKNPNLFFRLKNYDAPLLLQIVAKSRAPGVVRALQGALRLPGINLEATDGNGHNALKIAVHKNNETFVTLLLNAGAKVSDALLAFALERLDQHRISPAIFDLLRAVASQERPVSPSSRNKKVVTNARISSSPSTATIATYPADEKSSKDKELKK